jgi:hypothetical protein
MTISFILLIKAPKSLDQEKVSNLASRFWLNPSTLIPLFGHICSHVGLDWPFSLDKRVI